MKSFNTHSKEMKEFMNIFTLSNKEFKEIVLEKFKEELNEIYFKLKDK